MKHYVLSVALILLLSFNVHAQNTTGKGKITGKVTDAATKTPVDYATIGIYKQGSTAPINGTTTDPKGYFSINSLPYGDYRVTFDFLGYQRTTVDHVIISATNPTAVLNNILLAPSQQQLKTVEVVAPRNLVENHIDKMVYNAANDLTAQGGVATDLLKKIPQVTVDIDGNVELQGNANIRFLINGKPSSIFGASLADALQSIPASQIKSIEVITSPGAKYDASGTGGIINIILKDSKVQGVNGNVNLSAGTRLENGSLNLNARKGNVGVNAFFSGNEQINSTSVNTLDRQSHNADTLTHLSQNGNTAFKRGGYQSGLNFSWDITKKDQLTASVGLNHFQNHSNAVINQDQSMQLVSGNEFSNILSTRYSDSRFSANSTDVSLGYKKTFAKEDQELDVLVTSSSSKNNTDIAQTTQYFAGAYPQSGLTSSNPGKDRETDVSVDYTQPISKAFTLEAGAKGVFETLNNTTATDTLTANGSYIPNTYQTYSFNYTRDVYAAYLSATFSLFNDFINGKAGLRYERTNTQADFAGANIPGYNTFAPSFVLQHKLDATQSIKFAYSYRIQRPDYGDLNPFFNISDPHNINTGNIDLKPEIGHNYELGYNKTFDKGANIYIAAFYRYNTNDIQSFTSPDTTLVINGKVYPNAALTQRFNLGTETTTGINLFGSVPMSDKFSLRSNIFLGDRISENPGNPTVSGFAYRANLNATYQFSHDLTAEVFGNYNSSQRTIQGTRPQFAFYNLALRKQLWNKKASIGLTAANPFNQYVVQTTTTSTSNSYQTSTRQVPFRSFGISLSYKFGKLEFKKDKEKDEDDNKDNKDKNQIPNGDPKNTDNH